MSMRRLGVERIDLFRLHRIDPKVPLADQVGELKKLQDEGKIVAIGLSKSPSISSPKHAPSPTSPASKAATTSPTTAHRTFSTSARATVSPLSRRRPSPRAVSTTQRKARSARSPSARTPRRAGRDRLAAGRAPGRGAHPRHLAAAHLEQNLAAARLHLTSAEVETLSAAAG